MLERDIEMVRSITAFTEGGIDHLRLFKGLVQGGKEVSEKLGVIWFSVVSSIWKARNNIIFNLDWFQWERVMEESKILAWRIIKSRETGFNFSFMQVCRILSVYQVL
jgi:hypothetical protein